MDTGDLAPDFELPDQDGVQRKLSTLLAEGGPVVLFFYPAAMSPGCTAESCHFRDLAKEFAAVGAQRIGISNDRVEVQSEFADRHSLDYPLLSDTDGAVATEYGVKRRLGPLAVKRHTFVIDVDRRVLAVVRSELRMSVHADKALEVLRNRTA
ncbi:peroxiredoxin [Cryptosporangium sp. NPDC048952]|uniref:peroxiredoxin n=1 Tax=Cryptosporangium sp. NPDC048952 TaxID=3363961 RepID=UPI0037150B2D